MSIKLFANWRQNQLYVWGHEPGPMPIDRLRAVLGEISADALLASVVHETTMDAGRSPTSGRNEVAQGGDNGQRDIGQRDVGQVVIADPPVLATQRIGALVFAPDQAMDFLTSLPAELPESCDPSVAYWMALSRFVIGLISARQFIPRVDENSDGDLVASWRVVVSDKAHLQWLEAMALHLPVHGGDAPSDAAHVLESFLGHTADALIRRAVSGDPFFQDAQSRAGGHAAPMEMRWLTALLGSNCIVEGGETHERVAFIQLAHQWLGQLDDSQAAALRLCFVLHEPLDDEENPEQIDAALDDNESSEFLSSTEMDDSLTDEQDDDAGDAAQTGDVSDADASVRVDPMPGALVTIAPDSSDPLSGEQVSISSTEPLAAADATAKVAAAPVEAEAARRDWMLTLHLQGVDGEGDLIDAASLWETQGAGAPILGRTITKRRNALLGELARAAEVFPVVQQLLNEPAPSQLALTTTDAHAFIRFFSPQLRDRGFGVTVPEWALLPDEEIGLRLMLSPQEDGSAMFDPFTETSDEAAARRRSMGDSLELSTGHFGLDSLMDFNWQIAIGDLRISPADFEKLVAKNVPLVKHNGKWVNLDLAATRKAIEFINQQNASQMTLAEAFRTAFTAQKSLTGLSVLGLSGTGWLEKLLDQSPVSAIEAIGQPKSFAGDLRPYQLRGLHWLTFLDRLGLGACLADDMGLGKTIQLIALLLSERERYATLREQANNPNMPESPGPTLLFAPTSVVGNWLREVQRFAAKLKVIVHHGPDRLSGQAFIDSAQNSDVVITSYSLAHRDRDDLVRVRWHRVALDEAQKIKNPAAAASMAIRDIVSPRRIALTGTPIENHLSELWSIMQVLNPGLLGTAADFREKFAIPIEKLGERDRAEQLRRMIKPFVLRRTKQDPNIADDVPEKLEMKVFCNLTTEQAAVYEKLVNDSLKQIDSTTGIRRRGLILAMLTRLKQVCNHPALLESQSENLDHRSGKCERLIDMVEELLEEGDAALIFTQYREMGHLLEKLIHRRLNAKTFFLHGGTPAKNRDDMIIKFQAQQDAPRIFILSLRAGGLGLNLTAANHVFHFDRWWNPAVESQATDRAHRFGQTRKVQVHKFVCIGTMEERIDRMLTEKQALADQIVGSGDEWLTGLSTEQLRDYLVLSREAVGEFE